MSIWVIKLTKEAQVRREWFTFIGKLCEQLWSIKFENEFISNILFLHYNYSYIINAFFAFTFSSKQNNSSSRFFFQASLPSHSLTYFLFLTLILSQTLWLTLTLTLTQTFFFKSNPFFDKTCTDSSVFKQCYLLILKSIKR